MREIRRGCAALPDEIVVYALWDRTSGRYLIPLHAWGPLYLFVEQQENSYKKIVSILSNQQAEDATIHSQGAFKGMKFPNEAKAHLPSVPRGYDDSTTNGKSDFCHGVPNLLTALNKHFIYVDNFFGEMLNRYHSMAGNTALMKIFREFYKMAVEFEIIIDYLGELTSLVTKEDYVPPPDFRKKSQFISSFATKFGAKHTPDTLPAFSRHIVTERRLMDIFDKHLFQEKTKEAKPAPVTHPGTAAGMHPGAAQPVPAPHGYPGTTVGSFLGAAQSVPAPNGYPGAVVPHPGAGAVPHRLPASRDADDDTALAVCGYD